MGLYGSSSNNPATLYSFREELNVPSASIRPFGLNLATLIALGSVQYAIFLTLNSVALFAPLFVC
jgi:hypothetical protein